jgi:predicted branched-subunit amino acid permease
MIDRFWDGVRAGIPYAVAGGLLATSFGVLARDVGMPAWGAVLMSALAFAGSAQFAALTILGGGGGLGAALGAATLINSRFLPIGIAFAPFLRGGPLQRAAEGQAVVDASLVIARSRDGEGYDRGLLFGSTAAQYLMWVTGTAIGAFAGAVVGDPADLGFDAIFPAFFVALLIAELRSGRAQVVAVVGGLLALALVPFTPTGVPVLMASLATLIGLVRRDREPA